MPVVMTTKTVARKAMINLLVRVEFIAGQRSLYQNALPENALLSRHAHLI
jgi:hypothetical protein